MSRRPRVKSLISAFLIIGAVLAASQAHAGWYFKGLVLDTNDPIAEVRDAKPNGKLAWVVSVIKFPFKVLGSMKKGKLEILCFGSCDCGQGDD